MKEQTRSGAYGRRLKVASTMPSKGPHRRPVQPRALIGIAAAAALVIVAGVPKMPELLVPGEGDLPPARQNVVAVGSLWCGKDSGGDADRDCLAGDIASVVDALDPGLVLAVGDMELPAANDRGTKASRVWQRLAPRLRPVLSDQGRAMAALDVPPLSSSSYSDYYSYDYLGWHVIALNGDCADVGGCGPGSPQVRWLADDLRRSRAKCTMAYWNRPRFSSAGQGGDPSYDAFWQHLYAAGAELVVNTDAEGYERFARQAPNGDLDLQLGLREFVIGKGPAKVTSFAGQPLPRSVVRNGRVPGVLQLTLDSNAYRWQFVPIFGQRFRDAGTGACH
jgi:hypothetical protein